MRIGVDYRFLSAGVLAVNRGMGRYTQQQLRETIALDRANEYVLFCLPGADPELILPSVRSAPNVRIAEISISETRRPGPLPVITDQKLILRHAEEYQDWIYKQGIDLYHATAPYAWFDIPLIDFNVCPYVSTYYDAIPLAYSPFYLTPGSLLADLSIYANEITRRSDRLIAISNSARQDAIHYLGVREDKIDIAYPIADPWFRPMRPDERANKLGALRKRLELDAGYVMSVPHLHYSKNFENIITGYARLPRDLRGRLPLVVVCHLSEPEIDKIRAITDQLAVTDNVRLTGFVSEDELVALYGQATVFLHASRYEGFGLPALEAMHCGAPVVASFTSSLPEVVGDAAVLIDPNDPDSIAQGIIAVATSESLQNELRAKGFEQAHAFTGDRLGRATLGAYSRAVTQPTSRSGPRVAFWAPLPPLTTGAGDYSAELLEHLDPSFDLEVFVDDGYLPDERIWKTLRVNHFSAFARREAQQPFDVILYQMGASEYHWYMYEPLKRWSGLVTLHDLTWSHVQHLMFHKRADMKGFRKLIETLEGSEAAAAFDSIWKAAPDERPARLEDFLNSFYLLGDIIDGSLGIIVPTQNLGQEVAERYGPRKPIHTVLMGVTDPYLDAPRQEKDILRLELNLAQEAFVVGVFGSVAPVKRLRQIFLAFRELLQMAPHARLLIVGDGPAAYTAELDQLAVDLGISSAIQRYGHIPVMDVTGRREFHRLLQVCDVIVNLRWPSHKQMSGTLARAIAAGKPVVITDLTDWRDIPEAFCFRIPADDNEISALVDVLSRLARDAGLTDTMSLAARAYFEEQATLPRMAGQYADLIGRFSQRAVDPWPEPETPERPSAFNRPLGPDDLRRPALQAAMRSLGCVSTASAGAQVMPQFRLIDVVQGIAIQALNDGEARPGRRILVVGAAAHPLVFALSRSNEVHAVSDYLGTERRFVRMLTYPQALAPTSDDDFRLLAQHGDARALNFPDQYFDAVVSLRPLHELAQVDEISGLLTELRRVLRKGGEALLPAEVEVFSPPGREQAALQLGVQRLQVLTKRFSDAGFLLAHADAVNCDNRIHQPPRLDLATSTLSGFGRLVSTPVSITQGIVHTLAVFRLSRDATAEIVDPARPNRMRDHVRRSALLAADNVYGVNRPSAPNDPPSVSIFQNDQHPTGGVLNNSRLNSALTAFNRQRLRGWYNRTLARLPQSISAAARTIIRLLYLGHTQSAQFDLYSEMVQAIKSLEGIASNSAQRIDAMAADVRAIQVDQAGLTRRLDAQIIPNDHSQRLSAAEAEVTRLSDLLTELRVATSAVHQEVAQLRAQDYDAGIRILRSHLRLLEQIQQQHADLPDEPAMTSGLFRELLEGLEKLIPTIRAKTAVEVSVQPAREDLIAVGAEYFGDRLSAAAQIYRAPNDAWIHIDLSDRSSRQVLFTSARNRLASGGLLIVVSHAVVNPTAETKGLIGSEPVELTLSGLETPLTVNVWTRQ